MTRRQRAGILPIALAVFAGAVFAVLLAAFTYVRFPREVVLYRAQPSAPASSFSQEFEAAPGPAGNLWTLEIELADDPKPGQTFDASLNGVPLAVFSGDGKIRSLEFPGSALRDGRNVLHVESDRPWTCPRFRIVNVSGYSSGFIAAVVFPKTNSYPGVPDRPDSAAGWVLIILAAGAAAGLDFLSAGKSRRRPRFLEIARRARIAVPLLGLVPPALPLLSRYRTLVDRRSVLLMVALYIGLAFGREIGSALARAGRFLGRRARAFFAAAKTTLTRVPFLKTWDRAVSSMLLTALVFMALVAPGPTNIIKGDGIEYYAMTVSLSRFGTPYITPESAAYIGTLLGPVPGAPRADIYDWLKIVLNPMVKNGQELDPVHFWFYSLLAAVFFWPLRLFSISPVYCFVLLHVVLLVWAFAVVRRKLGPLAGVSLLLIVFGSPLLWFVTRPQIEFFMAMMGIIGFAFFVAENYLPAAFAFALASTQNLPFAILAGLVFVIGFARKKWALVRTSFPLWAGAGLLTLLSPAYYYLRHGILNPIVAGGAAHMGFDRLAGKKMISILFDPDIGLFPDWPVALILLVALGVLALKKKSGLKVPVWIFLGLSSFVLLWSQSRTTNFNHGGTYHITRYAVWYTPVFFLALWRVLASLPARRKIGRRSLMITAVFLCLAQGIDYLPIKPETYLERTRLSRFIYDKIPWLFDPVPEVFLERQIGGEEKLPWGVWALSTPSGSKILIFEDRLVYMSEDVLPPIPSAPDLDPVLVYKEAAKRASGEMKEVSFFINGMGAAFRKSGK
jgi:hypothetical protein